MSGNSGGLTPDNSGAEMYATVTSLAESRVAEGLLWAGTDDGYMHVTRDGGTTWTRVDEAMPDVPDFMWVSDVEASAADANTAYVAYDGHRSDNRDPWLFKTTDGGTTWTNLSGGLAPAQPIYVLVESDRNPNLLFAGTEFGVQMSMDAGRTWAAFGGRMTNGMPTVAVHDLVIHPRERDLVAGTHGRGLYILDDISALEQWTPEVAARPVHLFEQRRATLWEDMSRSGPTSDGLYAGENPPSVATPSRGQRDRARLQNTPVITMAFGPDASGTATLEITAPGGETGAVAIEARPGIVRYVWNGRFPSTGSGQAPSTGSGQAPSTGSGQGRGGQGRGGGRGGRGGGPAVLEPGTFGLTLRLGNARASGTLEVRADPAVSGS
jgi:hypothetical protein